MNDGVTERHRVLVDTNIVVDVLRGVDAARATLRARITAGEALLLSVLSRYELMSGARAGEHDALAEHLALYEQVPVDPAVADRGGTFAQTYRRSHSSIDAIDYLIAATAELRADELLTLHVKHFPMLAGLRAPYRA